MTSSLTLAAASREEASQSALLCGEELLRRRMPREAIRQLDRAEVVGADPDRCSAGRWTCWMLLGEWERAWRESDGIRARGLPDLHRFWDGSEFEGRRVMLRCLHGYGDGVQYLRYAPLLRARAERLMVQVAPALVALAQNVEGIDEIMTWGDGTVGGGRAPEPAWDMQIEVVELPYIFRSVPESVPPPARLSLPVELLDRAAMACGISKRPRVGVVWSGGDWDASRSVPFELLSGLLEVDAVELWSLQAEADNSYWYRYWSQRGRPARAGGEKSIVEMAAFAAQMDLVITVDTLAAHVAGSLGRPVWTMLKWAADWRWMLDRSDSPWYPTMRLFRQSREGDWVSVMGDVRRALDEWVGVRAQRAARV